MLATQPVPGIVLCCTSGICGFNKLDHFVGTEASNSNQSTTRGDMKDSHRLSLCSHDGDLRTDTCDLSVIATARNLTTVNFLTRA